MWQNFIYKRFQSFELSTAPKESPWERFKITCKRNVVILKGFLTGVSSPSWRKSWIYLTRSAIRWIGATWQFQIKQNTSNCRLLNFSLKMQGMNLSLLMSFRLLRGRVICITGDPDHSTEDYHSPKVSFPVPEWLGFLVIIFME